MIARQSLLVVANSALGAALGYVALFSMARYMGDEAYGARQFALSIVLLVGVLVRLGFPTTHTRRLARGEDVAGSTGAYLALKMGLLAAFLAVAGTLAWAWFVLLGRSVQDTTPLALLLGALVVVCQALRDVAVNSFRGLRLILEREAVLFTNTITTVALTVLVALGYADARGQWTPAGPLGPWAADVLGLAGDPSFDRGVALLMGAFLAGEVVALAVAWVLFLARRIPVARPRRAILADYWHATLPLMVLSLSAVVAKRVSHVMLGFWWDAGVLGQFAAAMRLSDLLLILANGVTITLLPAIAHLDRLGDLDGLRRLMIQSERWVSMLVWPVVVLVALASRPILHVLLSDDFLPAAPVLVLLTLQSLVTSLRTPIQSKAIGLGHHSFAARVAAVALVANVLLNVTLIPESLGPVPTAGLGSTGAALAALGSGMVLLLGYRGRAKEWTGHPFLSIHLRKHAVAAAATYGLLWLARPWFGLPALEHVRVWHLAGYGLAVLGLYLALLALLRELRRADWSDIRALVPGATPKNGGGV